MDHFKPFPAAFVGGPKHASELNFMKTSQKLNKKLHGQTLDGQTDKQA